RVQQLRVVVEAFQLGQSVGLAESHLPGEDRMLGAAFDIEGRRRQHADAEHADMGRVAEEGVMPALAGYLQAGQRDLLHQCLDGLGRFHAASPPNGPKSGAVVRSWARCPWITTSWPVARWMRSTVRGLEAAAGCRYTGQRADGCCVSWWCRIVVVTLVGEEWANGHVSCPLCQYEGYRNVYFGGASMKNPAEAGLGVGVSTVATRFRAFGSLQARR